MSLLIIEVAWTISAIFGFTLSVYNLFDVVTDKRVLKRSRLNGLRLLSINGAVRGEAVRLYIHLSFLLLGAIVLITPNEEGAATSAASWLVRIGLVAANWLLTYNTFADKRLRRQIFKYATDIENNKK